MKKYTYCLLVLISIIYVFSVHTFADVLFEDTFDNTSKVDISNTTALVDTAKGEVTLPRNKLPNAVTFTNSQGEFALIDNDQINFYDYDPSSNTMKKNDLLNISDITNPVGIAMGENYSIWAITKNEIRRYDFTGSGMSLNPYLSVTGLTDIFSVSSNPVDGTVTVLSENSNKKGIVTTFKTTAEGKLQEVPQLSFSTNLDNPLSLSMTKDTNDIAVSNDKGIYYYSFDASAGKYVENTVMTTVTGNPTVSVAVQSSGDGYVALNEVGADYYMYDVNVSQMSRVPMLSASNPKYSYAIALNQNSYDYALLDEDGNLQYWTYDNGTNKMVRNSSLELTGISIKKRYDSPKEYMSVLINSSNKYDAIRITSNEDPSIGGSIKWSVSIDGGTTWNDVVNGSMAKIPDSNSFVIKAVLEMADNINQPPPKIYNVKLEGLSFGTQNVQCIAITENAADQILPTTTFPVKAKKGSQVVFTVDTYGFTENVTVQIDGKPDVTMKPEKPTTEEFNTWTGSITFEPDEVQGKVFGATFVSSRGTKTVQFSIPDFVVIDQNVIYNIQLHLVR